NKPRRALQGQIGPSPLKENDESVPEADQKKDVDEDPDHPSHKAGKLNPAKIRHRRSPSNGRQGAHIQIMKRLGGETLAHAQNIARGMSSLLYCDGSKAGEKIAFFI